MLFYSVTEYVSFHFLNFPIQRIQGNTIYLRVNSEYRAVFISLRDFDLKHRFFKTGLCHLSALLLARQITLFFFFFCQLCLDRRMWYSSTRRYFFENVRCCVLFGFARFPFDISLVCYCQESPVNSKFC